MVASPTVHIRAHVLLILAQYAGGHAFWKRQVAQEVGVWHPDGKHAISCGKKSPEELCLMLGEPRCRHHRLYVGETLGLSHAYVPAASGLAKYYGYCCGHVVNSPGRLVERGDGQPIHPDVDISGQGAMGRRKDRDAP